MIETVEAPNSGYRYMPGVSQYSCGVAALPGFSLTRVRFSKVVPLKEGFARIAEAIASLRNTILRNAEQWPRHLRWLRTRARPCTR